MIWATASTPEAAAAWAYGQAACDVPRREAARADFDPCALGTSKRAAMAAVTLIGATVGLRRQLGLATETCAAFLGGPRGMAVVEATFGELTAPFLVEVARRELGDVDVLLVHVSHREPS